MLSGDSPAVDPLQGLDLAGLQADGIAEYFFNRSPLAKPTVTLWSGPPSGDGRDYYFSSNRLYRRCQCDVMCELRCG